MFFLLLRAVNRKCFKQHQDNFVIIFFSHGPKTILVYIIAEVTRGNISDYNRVFRKEHTEPLKAE
jgi:hypothetical protein